MKVEQKNQKQEYQKMLDEIFQITGRLEKIKDEHKKSGGDDLKMAMLLEMINHGGVLMVGLNELICTEKPLVDPKKIMNDAQRYVDLMKRHLKV